MILRNFLIFSSVVLLTISCAQKFPVPTDKEEGVMIFPVSVSNTSGHPGFAFSYNLIVEPETKNVFKIFPAIGKKYILFGNIPSGTYSITGIEFIGHSTNKSSVSTAHQIIKIKNAIFFEIKTGKVHILKDGMVIKKESTGIRSFTQGHDLYNVSDMEIEEITKELKKLENAEKWDFTQN